MSANTPFGASLTESGGKLYQSPTYEYGSPYTYKSSLPVYGGNPGGSLPSPGGGSPNYLSVNVGGSGLAPFMTGQYVTTDFVQGQYAGALASSNGRTDNSMTLNEPGSIVG